MIYNRSLKDYYLRKKIADDHLIPFLLGRSAINFLIELYPIKAIILPRFICPIMVEIFKHHQVEIFYYESLTSELDVPINDILTNLSNVQSEHQLFFLWHDYLNIIGDIPFELDDYLLKNNIKTIVDATHSLPIKDYKSPVVIYGFRKLLNEPYGAFVKLDNGLNSVSTSHPPLKLFFFMIAFKIRASMLYIFKITENNFLNKLSVRLSNANLKFNFDQSYDFLHDSFQKPSITKKHRRLDYKKISKNRERNFHRYAEKLNVSFDLGKLNTSCPYGFPLLIKNNLQLRKKLWNKGIHSFILWNKLHPNIEENKSLVSEYLSNSIIILPVNHDLPIKDIDTVIEAINE